MHVHAIKRGTVPLRKEKTQQNNMDSPPSYKNETTLLEQILSEFWNDEPPPPVTKKTQQNYDKLPPSANEKTTLQE